MSQKPSDKVFTGHEGVDLDAGHTFISVVGETNEEQDICGSHPAREVITRRLLSPMAAKRSGHAPVPLRHFCWYLLSLDLAVDTPTTFKG